MARKSLQLLAVPALLMLVGLYWNAGINRSKPSPKPLYPLLRHDNVIYIGGVVEGSVDLPEGRVVTGEYPSRYNEARLGAQVGTVVPSASAAPANLLMENQGRYVPPGTTLFAVKQLDPAHRLMGKTPDAWMTFQQHPVSKARTLGDVLLQAWKSVPNGTLQVNSVSLRSLSDRRKRVVVDDRREIDALVVPSLAAPVDWTLAAGGEAYDLVFQPPKTAVIHMTYFPETGLLAVQLDLHGWGVVGIPVYAPAELRSQLDSLVREALLPAP